MKKYAAVILGAFIFAACGVPKDEHAALQDKMNRLEKELEQERLHKKSLASNLDEVKSDLTQTKSNLNEIKTEKKKLEEKTQTYQDLVSSLKGEIESGKIKITEMKNRLTVNLIDKILFASGSTKIQREGKGALKKVADVLKEIQDKRIEVEGHTDNVPISGALKKRFPSNWELSTTRATAVVKFLAENGVAPEKLSATGFGEFRPVSSNKKPEGRSQNRRIEIVLLPELRK